jgi:hypothetical protein
MDQVHYGGGGWSHVVNTVIPNSFDGTVSLTANTNDSATITWTGTQIKYYAGERPNRGIAAVSIDGGPETSIDEYAAQDTGDVLVFTSQVLATGTHTLKVRNTGMKDSASAGTNVCIDRFDILS